MEKQAKVIQLLQLMTQQSASDNEMATLLTIVEEDETGTMISLIEEELIANSSVAQKPYDARQWEQVAGKILSADKLNTPTILTPVHRHWQKRRWAAAAAVLLIASSVGFWLLTKKEKTTQSVTGTAVSKPVPGRNGAILTLSDGSVIGLDSSGKGLLALQEGTHIQFGDAGIAYDASQAEKVVYNTLSTPKGRKFHVQLPDGSKVWLNAESSIRYPTAFKGSDRIVSMTGEAYFEVAKNAAMPFRVLVGNKAAVHVLGTQFNVNAYPNRGSIDATLIDGVVEFAAMDQEGMQKERSLRLQPGQQAKLQERLTLIAQADINKITAWKQGFFNFEKEALREVMQQLERWYDIHVVYPEKMPDILFFGELSMDTPLEGVLRALENSGVHFKVNGRTITVND